MNQIVCAKPHHLPLIMPIYAHAQKLMIQYGNLNQWPVGHPSQEIISLDIEKQHTFLLLSPSLQILGVFALVQGEDPTYAHIIDGQWLNDDPYVTLHRVATSSLQKNTFRQILDWTLAHHPNIRIDTHADNAPMLHILQDYGFVRCGTIFVANGSPRVALQYIRKNAY